VPRRPAAAAAAPQRISADAVRLNIRISPHCASSVAPAPTMNATPTDFAAAAGDPPTWSMMRKPSAWPVAAWTLPDTKP